MKTKLLSITAVIALSINAFAQIPTNGLVAYYQFNSNANDLSGNNNSGTVNGATLVTDRNGNANSAYSFDGSTSYIDIPHSSSLTFTSNAISISFWAKIISVPGNGYNGIIVSKQAGSGTTQQGFNVFGNTAQTVGLQVSNGGGNFGGNNNYSVSLNQYHHFVYIYENNNALAYIDGIQAGGALAQTATIGANTMNLLIGKANWSNVNAPNFNGILDELQIYNRGLTPTEVAQIYSGSCSTVDISTGLVALYDFTGNANDLSGNSLNGVVTGATLTTDRFGNANKAYSFNGSTDNISINTNSLLDFQTANKFSISYWINPSSLSGSQSSVIVSKQIGSSTSQDGWNSNIDVNSSSNFRIQNGTSTSACALGSNASTIIINTDYHIVQVNDNGTSYVYINGVLATQASCVALIGDNTSAMLIGKPTWTFSNVKGFAGKIDDIRIYNRALSVCDIDSLFTMPNLCVGVTASISANGPVIFCQGGNVILTATTATSYLWNNNATTQSITVSNAGANSVTTINSNGCPATSATTTVTVNSKPTVLTNNPSAVCSPATVDITLPAITTGSTGGLTYSYFSNAGATTPYLTPAAAITGTYYIIGATSNSCTDTTAVTVTVNPLPTVTASATDSTICNGDSIIFTGGGASIYSWSGSVVNGIPFSPISTTTYTVTGTDANSCINTGTVTVTLNTPDITTGLVARFDFTGNANDLSGNSLNGTVTGAILTSDRFGNANNAYLFNGSTDNISINTNSLLDFQTTNKFSISYWIKPTTLSTSQTSVILSKQIGSGSSQDGWNSNIDVNSSSNFRIQNGTSTSACALSSNASTIAINQDYHIVQTYDNGTSSIYINGILSSQSTCVALIGDNTSVMLIGKATWTFSNTKGFNGTIDDIRIYNTALSECGIDTLYNMPNPLTTKIGENKSDLTATIYPNPATSTISIVGLAKGNFVELLDLTGRIIFTTNESQIDISNFNNGMYFLRVFDTKENKVIKTFKLIKE